MISKDYFIPIDPDDPADEAGERIRVRLNQEHGLIMDFTAQYETPHPDAPHGHFPVIRFDTAHGRPHRDELDARGQTIEGGKQWFAPHVTFNQALNDAIDDIERNWRRYRERFLRRMQ